MPAQRVYLETGQVVLASPEPYRGPWPEYKERPCSDINFRLWLRKGDAWFEMAHFEEFAWVWSMGGGHAFGAKVVIRDEAVADLLVDGTAYAITPKVYPAWHARRGEDLEGGEIPVQVGELTTITESTEMKPAGWKRACVWTIAGMDRFTRIAQQPFTKTVELKGTVDEVFRQIVALVNEHHGREVIRVSTNDSPCTIPCHFKVDQVMPAWLFDDLCWLDQGVATLEVVPSPVDLVPEVRLVPSGAGLRGVSLRGYHDAEDPTGRDTHRVLVNDVSRGQGDVEPQCNAAKVIWRGGEVRRATADKDVRELTANRRHFADEATAVAYAETVLNVLAKASKKQMCAIGGVGDYACDFDARPGHVIALTDGEKHIVKRLIQTQYKQSETFVGVSAGVPLPIHQTRQLVNTNDKNA